MADDNDTAPPADEADDAVTAGESMVSAPKDATDAELDSALQVRAGAHLEAVALAATPARRYAMPRAAGAAATSAAAA